MKYRIANDHIIHLISQRLLLVLGLAVGFVPIIAFAQNNAVPLVNAPLVPSTAVPGGPAFTLTVNGTGFVPGSLVNWKGSARTTKFVSQSQLTAMISASDIASATTALVMVTNPAPGGGTSNTAYFSVTLPKAAVPFT